MPVQSKAQLRAMYAAKEGKSTLGIPQNVGKEFTEKTTTTKGLPEKVDHVQGYLDACIRGDSSKIQYHREKIEFHKKQIHKLRNEE